jgi:zinc transport system substrate-binding protein
MKMKMVVMTLWRAGTLAASALTLAVSLTGCGSGDPSAASSGKVEVVAAFYPFAFIAQQVGGDDVTVVNLTKPGAEPHDLELTPRQVTAISEADLAIYLKGFQPSVDEAIQQNKPAHMLEVSTVVPLTRPAPPEEAEGESPNQAHPSGDPHIWLDPTKLATVARAVGDQLAAADARHTAGFRARAAALATRLDGLDADLSAGLKNCRQRAFVTSHAAFGYFAERYGLEQIAIAGISPEEEPAPARIQEIQREVKDHDITTIFFETLVSPDLAETIARDTGATTAVLDPIEGIKDPTRDDYFSVMRANLGALQKALGPC